MPSSESKDEDDIREMERVYKPHNNSSKLQQIVFKEKSC